MESKSITIWIEGGICQDVFNLPEGWQYEVLDTDEGKGRRRHRNGWMISAETSAARPLASCSTIWAEQQIDS